jgi:fructose-bisphosphate aldolase/6-deoxy-5-ketofructose 1-phosphate synthase
MQTLLQETKMELTIPATVPPDKKETYRKHYATITKETDRLLLFAADQKMEHLNKDFFGPDLAPEINHPDHVFSIAAQSNIGVFAAHLGLISRYGGQYQKVNYLPKLDGKTNLSPGEPYSQQIWNVQDAIDIAKNGDLNICGVGYTVYVGSQYEREMLTEAATIVKNAHAQGLLAILWMYPRGKQVPNQLDANIIAGAAGLGASLGADFVKVNEPESGPQDLRQAVDAAGNTKVIVSGGAAIDPQECLKRVTAQLKLGNVSGAAVGRNIFQHPLQEAITIANQLADIIYG